MGKRVIIIIFLVVGFSVMGCFNKPPQSMRAQELQIQIDICEGNRIQLQKQLKELQQRQ